MFQPMQAPVGIPRCSRPLRARRTIACQDRNRIRGYPRLSRNARPIPTGCPQDSHGCRARRNNVQPSNHADRGVGPTGHRGHFQSRAGKTSSGGATSGCPGRSTISSSMPSHLLTTTWRTLSPMWRNLRTTKRPKEPRYRSLRLQCKHRSRHFRSRGPFGQDLH